MLLIPPAAAVASAAAQTALAGYLLATTIVSNTLSLQFRTVDDIPSRYFVDQQSI